MSEGCSFRPFSANYTFSCPTYRFNCVRSQFEGYYITPSPFASVLSTVCVLAARGELTQNPFRLHTPYPPKAQRRLEDGKNLVSGQEVIACVPPRSERAGRQETGGGDYSRLAAEINHGWRAWRSFNSGARVHNMDDAETPSGQGIRHGPCLDRNTRRGKSRPHAEVSILRVYGACEIGTIEDGADKNTAIRR